jgi:hypothetical protein
MFESLDFTTVTAGGRSKSNDLVSITHNHTSSKNELMFRISKEAMDLAGLNYQDKLIIQFADNDSVCRFVRSDEKGAVLLSKQVKNNPLSAGIVRLTHKYGLPNFLKNETEKEGKEISKVKYVHEKEMIQYVEELGQLTFKLMRDEIVAKEEV